jgi:toxin ParE1/3/4
MKRRRLRVTASARADLDRIALSILEYSGSVDWALKWLSDAEIKFAKLADAPGTGTPQVDLERGLRSSPFGNYLVFFRATARVVTIVRVVHGARDLGGGLPAD